jgi:hypothetical protein
MDEFPTIDPPRQQALSLPRRNTLRHAARVLTRPRGADVIVKIFHHESEHSAAELAAPCLRHPIKIDGTEESW